MPNPTDRNPRVEQDRLVKKSEAAQIVGVKRQYVPVLIASKRLVIEEIGGVEFVTRASAEAERDRRLAKQKEKVAERNASAA